MINCEEIMVKALRAYPKFLASLITREDIFPIEIKGDKGNKLPLLKRTQGMKNIFKNSKDSLGYGYSLLTINKNTKSEGSQTFISKILFQNEWDFIRFLDMGNEVESFKVSTKKLLKYPLRELIITKPKLIANNLEIIDDVIKVMDFFIHNSVGAYYVRELPIDVHTKFIENNSSFLITLLDIVLHAESIDFAEKSFSKRYGLRFDDNFYIYIRSLDSELKLNGFLEVVLPWDQVNNLKIKPTNIFIVENRVNYLLYKNRVNSIVIWGRGRAVTKLKELDLLSNSKIYYWGDIDPSGFEILNSLRLYYPNVVSLYMDNSTLKNYRDFIVQIKGFKEMELKNLTTDELKIYKSLFCGDYQIRLEQENIRPKYMT